MNLSLSLNLHTTEQPPQLYRVLHDIEMGPVWRPSLPEVFSFDPAGATPFTKEWQLVSYAMNPGMTKEHWRSLYGEHTAFMNDTGFDGGTARADFVNGLNLDAPLPRFDKSRVCGGAVITGVEQDGYLIVKTLDGNSPPPPIADILARPWLYFCATTCRSDGSIGRFPQGDGADVLVPLIASTTVRIPLSNLEKLPPGVMTDPYTVYYPKANNLQVYTLAAGAAYERRVITSPRRVVAHIVTVDLSRVKWMFVTPEPTVATKPSEYAARYSPLFLVNGDEHTYPFLDDPYRPATKGRAMSDGIVYSTSKDEVSLNTHFNPPATQIGISYGFSSWASNVVSGSHELLKGFIVPTGLDNITLDPRTMVGINGSTAYFVILEGRLPDNLGLSIKEAAQFMAELGARDAIMLDGGKDSTLWIRGLGVVNQLPEGEQAIANCLAVWM